MDFRKADLPSPPADIQLFFTRLPVQIRIVIKNPTQCKRCWAFHRPETCSRPPRCVHCAATNHSSEQHMQQTSSHPACGAPSGQCQCPNCWANCYGPHKATDKLCPLLQAPNCPRKTRIEVENIRQTGQAPRAAKNTCTSQSTAQSQTRTSIDV